MANTLKLKRSSVAAKIPLTTDLQLSEMAINTTDGRLFTKKNVSATDYIVEFLNTDSAMKPNVRAATTANITLSGTQTVDGVALAVGDRVLVKNQSSAATNGIYLVAAGAWTRTHDLDTAAKAASAIVAVSEGTTNGGKTFDSDFKATDTLNTTSMAFNRVLDLGAVGVDVQAYDADLGAIAALAGTSGFLKKTAANTWTLDTSTYLTSAVTTISFGTTGLTPSTATNGAVTVSGTLGVANGGTGGTTFTSGALLKGAGTSPITEAIAGTDYPDLNGSNTFNSGSQTLAWTDTGGTVGPSVLLYRNRASPAASDALGGVYYQGNSSVGTLRNFGVLYAIATTVTDGAEDGELVYRGIASGAVAERVRFGADGVIRTKINASANAGVVISKHWTSLTADYTLTNTASGQKLFNNPTNGTLTLPTGVYEFDCLLYLTTMSSTGGNMQFSLVGAGTATIDRVMYVTAGADSSTPTTAASGGSAVSVTALSSSFIVPTATGTGMCVMIKGMFRVTGAGTIIPSCLLSNAAAAVVKAGSHFKCAKIGETTETRVGAWT